MIDKTQILVIFETLKHLDFDNQSKSLFHRVMSIKSQKCLYCRLDTARGWAVYEKVRFFLTRRVENSFIQIIHCIQNTIITF